MALHGGRPIDQVLDVAPLRLRPYKGRRRCQAVFAVAGLGWSWAVTVERKEEKAWWEHERSVDAGYCWITRAARWKRAKD
jgi:hypothetical protein